ncbi:MAG TPA: hypothetical protein VHK01_02575 [Lacipirellulaceae bacterium]|jgi:hypothetical protein|nr:hypothetical protein [Lacipirellulaceae bacterium]
MALQYFKRKQAETARGQDRAGLTVLEFVGCVMAVVGGAWLGALYLGVDVRNLAYTALAEAELLESVPQKLRPAAPGDNPMTREQLVATLREELGTLRLELKALRSGEATNRPTFVAAAPDGDASEPTGAPQASLEKTLAYWARTSEIALAEAALQKDAESAANSSNASRVFTIKGRISRFAAKAVEAIPSDGVDDSVIHFGRQLASWYNHGGELYERAVRIWETPTISENREQLNEDWRRAQAHHNNEARLVNEKAEAVRSTVSRNFGEEFPNFATPADAPKGTGA